MPVTRASLSLDPKCAIANSFTGIGVWLIATSPIASIGLPSAPVIPATNWATPSATAATSTPESAPASRAGQVISRRFAVTQRIRSRGTGRLGQRP
jgi:hypothetical protein